MDNDVHMEDCPKSDEEFPTSVTSSTEKYPNNGSQSHRQAQQSRLTETISSINQNPSAFLLNPTSWTTLVNAIQNPIQSKPFLGSHSNHSSSLSSTSSSCSANGQTEYFCDSQQNSLQPGTSTALFGQGTGLAQSQLQHLLSSCQQKQSPTMAISEALMTSPHNLVINGLLSPDALGNHLLWDQWMCMLATSLSPAQWQAYWRSYAAIFGVGALPTHLLSFFSEILANHDNNSISAAPMDHDEDMRESFVAYRGAEARRNALKLKEHIRQSRF
ncbi:hypothetical protein DdX_13354 [Ditylenchus destructor]|uniref:Uncharacterized protein n=1 Tax=Ditylenchus destructor TaxID=166010 RepID=A0AAD4R2Y5_9BILA|nr:hypothetical protein DdX_13354 [Ditylenchus destructor]